MKAFRRELFGLGWIFVLAFGCGGESTTIEDEDAGAKPTIEQVCQKVYDALNAPGCLEDNLIESCLANYYDTPACQTQYYDFYTCYGEKVTPATCLDPNVYMQCKPESDAVEICTKGN